MFDRVLTTPLIIFDEILKMRRQSWECSPSEVPRTHLYSKKHLTKTHYLYNPKIDCNQHCNVNGVIL